MKNKALIIILNWNGTNDTIECCASLERSKCLSKFDVLVIDNDSQEEEYLKLKTKLSEMGCCSKLEKERCFFDGEFLFKELNSISSKNRTYFVCRSGKNHGFAKACNYGAKFALSSEYEYVLFLNNDTVVEPDFLDPLVDTLEKTEAKGVIPQIRYEYNHDIIWNCGGEISKLGKRKYYYANANVKDTNFGVDVFDVSFATGCCLLFKTRFFIEIGMFSERFFFGEEDIELSLRLLSQKHKLACNIKSLIYHKVGASISGSGERITRKAYVHYLNRFVNMRLYLKNCRWILWVAPSAIKVFINLIRINKLTVHESLLFIKHLLADSYRLDCVSKDKFELILKDGYKNS